MKPGKLAAGLFVTAAALFIPVSAVRAATAPAICESVQPANTGLTYGCQSGIISVSTSGTDGDGLENVSGVIGSKNGTVEADGTVIRQEPGGIFQVTSDDGQTVVAAISGKLRMNFIRIRTGDRVRVEFFPDTMKGRIIWRYSNK